MFQFETVGDCSCIPRSVIEDTPLVAFLDCCDTRTKEIKNVRIGYGLFVYRDKRSEHRPDFICGEKLARQRISLENAEVKFERTVHKEVVYFNVLLAEPAQWRGGLAEIPGMLQSNCRDAAV